MGNTTRTIENIGSLNYNQTKLQDLNSVTGRNIW